MIFESENASDWSRVLSGGLNRGDSVYRQLFDANLTLETERLGGWNGGVFFAAFQNQNGPNGSELIGDIQTYSNIDADGRTQLAAMWFEQRFFDDQLRIKLGKMDANEEFAFPEFAQLFVQSSMGYSPTIFPMPTYPDPATGIELFWQVTESLVLGYGLFDGALAAGVPTGSRGPKTFFDRTGGEFHIAQLEQRWQLDLNELDGRGIIGGWYHTGRFQQFDGDTVTGASGLFLTLDQQVFRESDPTEDWQGVGVFLQYGLADPNVSAFEHHVGAGLAWTVAIPTRDVDVLGFGVSWVRLSGSPGAGFTAPHETSTELFYQCQLTGWMRLVFDLQYIKTPGGHSAAPDALASTIRTIVSF